MIYIKNLVKKFGEFYALKGIDLEIYQGEVVVLKGKSGSGKSTLLSLLSGLSKPTKGTILVDNTNIAALSEYHSAKFRLENIGFIFQRYNLLEQMSVEKNLLSPLIPLNLDDETIDIKISTLLKRFDLEDKRDVVVKKLSGGEQQRVAIARSLINNPKLIIADEPTANLDEALSKKFIAYIKTLKQEGKTILIATHDPLFFDLKFVDRIIEIKGGQCY